MSFFHLAILSFIQGLTEFLPVSSSGHLVLAPHLLGMKDQGLLIDVALHIGTMCAIILYYRRDIFSILRAVLQGKKAQDQGARKLGWQIAVASIPAFIVGGFLHFYDPDGIRSVAVITATTLFFGLLMGLADMYGRKDRAMGDVTFKSAFIVGCAQVLALIPGTSRSGITITAARFLGFNRVDAARFSFFIGLPVMAAAGLVSLFELLRAPETGLWHEVLGAIALSFGFGLCAIHFMMTWLKKSDLLVFVVYRMFLGGFLLVWFFT